MKIDLSELDTSKTSEMGSEMILCDPRTGQPIVDEEGNSIVFTLAGKDSARFQNAKRSFITRRIGNPKKPTANEIENESLELLAQVTLKWSPNLVVDGETPQCTPATAKSLYQRFPWIKEQVDEHISDRSNYLGNSSRSSQSTLSGTSSSKQA